MTVAARGDRPRVCRTPHGRRADPTHGTNVSVLAGEAEEAGWVLVRYELTVGTYHYLAIPVQTDLFPSEKKKRRRVRLELLVATSPAAADDRRVYISSAAGSRLTRPTTGRDRMGS